MIKTNAEFERESKTKCGKQSYFIPGKNGNKTESTKK